MASISIEGIQSAPYAQASMCETAQGGDRLMRSQIATTQCYSRAHREH